MWKCQEKEGRDKFGMFNALCPLVNESEMFFWSLCFWCIRTTLFPCSRSQLSYHPSKMNNEIVSVPWFFFYVLSFEVWCLSAEVKFCSDFLDHTDERPYRAPREQLFQVGEVLRFRRGPLKGYLCRVVRIFRNDVTVKLDSLLKIVTG